jgi:diaminopimelate epimerase
VQVLSDESIKLRTYERGVEDETLACGTGSVASAIISALLRQLHPPINVLTRSGEWLKIDFRIKENFIKDVSLEGSAHVVFQGELRYQSEQKHLVE